MGMILNVDKITTTKDCEAHECVTRFGKLVGIRAFVSWCDGRQRIRDESTVGYGWYHFRPTDIDAAIAWVCENVDADGNVAAIVDALERMRDDDELWFWMCL